MALEEIEKEIYGLRAKPKKKIKVEPPANQPEPPEQWPEFDLKPSNSRKVGRYFLRLIIVICLAAIAVSAVLVYSHFRSSKQLILIEITAPPEIKIGAPFEIVININNQSETAVRDAVLNLILPADLLKLTNADEEKLGDINRGGVVKKTFLLVATPVTNEKINNKIEVTLSYFLNSNTRFERKTAQELNIGQPAIKFSIKAPAQVLNSSNFDVEINYLNDSPFNFDNLSFEIKYPADFRLIGADPQPTSLNNYWQTNGLAPQTKGSFKITGLTTAPPQSFFNVPVLVKTRLAGQEIQIAEGAINFAVTPSPLNLTLSINNNLNYAARINDRLNYILRYQNNSGISLIDVVIKAKLTGELFDLTELKTKADIDAVNNILTWNAANSPELRLLAPGASGEANFEIKLAPVFPIKRLNDKNFTVRVEATIDSPTVPYYLNASKTSAAAKLETKVAGLIEIDAQAFYRDAPSGILNTGFLPPKINQPTQYTVHWLIKNYATDVKNIEIRASLQSGVKWTGMLKSNTDSVPLYNERTNEVVWLIEKIPATKGVISPPLEAIFQIEATPNPTQNNNYQPLAGETRIKAFDEFVGLQLENSDAALTTALPDDPTVGQNGGRVTP